MAHVVDAVLNSYSLLRASELLKEIRCITWLFYPTLMRAIGRSFFGSKRDRRPVLET
jgi:hypothetical protein